MSQAARMKPGAAAAVHGGNDPSSAIRAWEEDAVALWPYCHVEARTPRLCARSALHDAAERAATAP